MTAKRPGSQSKGKATPTAPQNEDVNVVADDLDVEEVLGGYEAQIGQLTGQLIRQNVLIRSLRKELLKKNAGTAEPG